MKAIKVAALTMILFVNGLVAHANHDEKSADGGDFHFGPVPNEPNHQHDDED